MVVVQPVLATTVVFALPRVRVLYASVEGFMKLPLIGRLLVPSVPSRDGAAAETGAAKAGRR